VHLVVCLSVMQSSTYVFFLAVGYRKDASAPIFKDYPLGKRAVDPVVQSLTLTDIVVSITVTALLLALVIEIWKRSRIVDPDELRQKAAVSVLVPLVVAIPLIVAALLVASARWLSPVVANVVAAAVAATVTVLAVVLIFRTSHGAIDYWFGGWHPRHGIAIGVSFHVEPLGAGIAAATGRARDRGAPVLARILRRARPALLPRTDAGLPRRDGRVLDLG